MANVPSEADRLLEAGRKKTRRACLLWGGPLLAILVLAGLQCAGAVRLEEYFAADQRVIWLALALLALLQFLFGAIGVLQGWVWMRRARQLRQQSAPAPMWRNRQGIPRPRHFFVRDDGRSLRIRFRWVWDKFTGPATMCLAWNGFLASFFWLGLRSGGRERWLMIIMIFHVAVGLLLIYATLAGLLNRTVIKVTSEFLSVRHGPVPWWGNRRLPVDGLERLSCDKDTDPETQKWTYVYGVHALTKGGSKVDLVTELDRAQALFIKEELERWLNIND
jgi:hypothetical protein